MRTANMPFIRLPPHMIKILQIHRISVPTVPRPTIRIVLDASDEEAASVPVFV
jgi:hypothetical protein